MNSNFISAVIIIVIVSSAATAAATAAAATTAATAKKESDLSPAISWRGHVDHSVIIPPQRLTPIQGRMAFLQATNARTEKEYHSYVYFAGQTGNLDTAELLLEYGLLPSVLRRDGSVNPVIDTIIHNDTDALRSVLLDHPDGRLFARLPHSFSDMTPLMIAASLGHAAVASLLIDLGGADPTARHPFAGSTALHFAAELGWAEVIGVLCRHGADANAAKVDRGRPLHVAAERRHVGAVKMLLSPVCRAEVNALLLDDTTALYLACQTGFVDVAEVLIDGGADMDFVMPVRMASGKQLVVRSPAVAAAHNDPDSFNDDPDLGIFGNEAPNGATAMHVAAENGHCDAVELLLRRGAKQLPSMLGNSPLDTALQYRQFRIAELLFSYEQPDSPKERKKRK